MGRAIKGYSRTERVAEQIQRLLAERLRKGLKDPRLAWVTVTDVKVSRDYSYATVYYTVMDNSARDASQAALERASGYLRSDIGRSLTLFTVPQLNFVYDESIERGFMIGRLIEQAVTEDKARAGQDGQTDSDQAAADEAATQQRKQT